MNHRKQKEKLMLLKAWMKEKKEANQEMTAKEHVLKHNGHALMANERQMKREKVRLNREKRNEKWKKRHKKKDK